MTQIHLQRDNLLKQKGRIQSSLFNAEQSPLFTAETLPQQEKEWLNERLSNILTQKGNQSNEIT